MRQPRARIAAAALTAAFVLGLYAATLLPGQDLGDSASFQAIAGERSLTPRQGYPLYFAVTGLFVAALPVEPARAANLASAVEAALAAGVLVLVGAEIGGAVIAGLVAALLLAGSYTAWSQATITEVYSLHLLLVGLSLHALVAWHRRPSLGRLAAFFAVYALGFGNHLQMALLLPAFALFLLVGSPEGPRAILKPRVLLLAAGLACLFSLQYAWNLSWLYYEPNHPPLADNLRTFWFDVTKSDWRANMVVTIPWSMIGDRFAMYWFDLRQQFGVPGVCLALAGAWFLVTTSWRVGLLLATAWLVNWAFAFTYNVGDVHVFYLSSHLFVALAAGCGAGWAWLTLGWHLEKRLPVRGAGAPLSQVALAILLLAYPAWRIWDTYPALDRSDDGWARQAMEGLVAGIDPRREVLASDLNWQLHNGLDYFSKHTRPELPVVDTPATLGWFPFIVWDNAAAGRDVVLTDGSAEMVRAAYGRLLPIEPDPRVEVRPLSERVRRYGPGQLYVLVWIDSYPENPVAPEEFAATVRLLTGAPFQVPGRRYVALAGITGRTPEVVAASERPFRIRRNVAGRSIDIRIECWLQADTIRRMGFGTVIADRRHLGTLDRGLSFVAVPAEGAEPWTAWEGGLHSPRRRYVIRHEAGRP